MEYFCCTDDRRDAVARHGTLNGIEFIEVIDDPSMPDNLRQRTLRLHTIKPLTAGQLTVDHIRIEGGERITKITIASAQLDAQDNKVLVIEVDPPGDFSIYTLRLIDPSSASSGDVQPAPNFDPLLSQVDFSFKVTCPSDFDCKPESECPPEASEAPELNYLAKDYATFRQLMLDRMAVLMPDWRERSPADLGILLVEVLAYVADRMSYQQDAIASEAYLGTARRRVSVRRHARMVDYFLSDGSNARAWVHVRLKASAPTQPIALPIKTRFLTKCAEAPYPPVFATSELPSLLRQRNPTVFEAMQDAQIFRAHNELPFYTWGATECCLPAGSTRATLRGKFPDLKQFDALLLEEVKGPRTGIPEDADPTHRHVVRLSKPPKVTTDPLGGQFNDPRTDDPVDITEIEWFADDALPFALCISSITEGQSAQAISSVSVARGNLVLADHGLSIAGESLGAVPEPLVFVLVNGGRCEGGPSRAALPARFTPRLTNAPLTQAASVPVIVKAGNTTKTELRAFDASKSAASAFAWLPANVLPAISLLEGGVTRWKPKRDLLKSSATSEEFVAEIENDGTARIRFGDDAHGERPAAGVSFTADYRVGNGSAGNLGADALVHLVSDASDLAGNVAEVRNPLPARGGVDPESIEDVRKNAPQAFRIQERAVTEADYAEVTQRQTDLRIQRAAATTRWTGSWRTMFVTADRLNNLAVDDDFETALRERLERYRMAGQDLEVDAPQFVPLEIEMTVCAKPDYFRSDVKVALLRVFSNRILPNGTRGVFHADNFTFGQPVYLSVLVDAAMAVEGVSTVTVTKFQRKGVDETASLNKGVLTFGRLEIAQLDNDPNLQERGTFKLEVQGGK